MKDKKFYRKVFNLFFLLIFTVFLMSPNFAEAKYFIGIVGINNRTIKINLGTYTNTDGSTVDALTYAQTVFEDVMTDDLPSISREFGGIEKTKYSKMARENEAEFQKIQEQMGKAMSGLDKGNISEAVKLFDKKLDYFVYCYVDNYTATHRKSLGGLNETVRVDLTVRIVDAFTGKIVCVATGKGESASHEGKGIQLYQWDEALRKALNQIVEKIQKQV